MLEALLNEYTNATGITPADSTKEFFSSHPEIKHSPEVEQKYIRYLAYTIAGGIDSTFDADSEYAVGDCDNITTSGYIYQVISADAKYLHYSDGTADSLSVPLPTVLTGKCHFRGDVIATKPGCILRIGPDVMIDGAAVGFDTVQYVKTDAEALSV